MSIGLSNSNDVDRFKFSTDQLYLKSVGDMRRSFKDHPQALENTTAIADRCHIEFDLGAIFILQTLR